MNLRVPKMRGISWLAAEPVSFSRRTLLHGVSKYWHASTQAELNFFAVYMRPPYTHAVAPRDTYETYNTEARERTHTHTEPQWSFWVTKDWNEGFRRYEVVSVSTKLWSRREDRYKRTYKVSRRTWSCLVSQTETYHLQLSPTATKMNCQEVFLTSNIQFWLLHGISTQRH